MNTKWKRNTFITLVLLGLAGVFLTLGEACTVEESFDTFGSSSECSPSPEQATVFVDDVFPSVMEAPSDEVTRCGGCHHEGNFASNVFTIPRTFQTEDEALDFLCFLEQFPLTGVKDALNNSAIGSHSGAIDPAKTIVLDWIDSF